MPRIVQSCAALLLFIACSACSSPRIPDPSPLSVGHMDIVQKQEHIARTKTTLKSFRVAARDVATRDLPDSLRELGDHFERYVEVQVDPIVNDAEARNNLATRMEVAKLQLLCGLTYLELGDHGRMKSLLLDMEGHYRDPVFLSTPLDRGDFGVISIEEGMQILRDETAKTAADEDAKPKSPGESGPRKEESWKRIFSTQSPKG